MVTAEKKKICEQCHGEKDIDLFRKVTNQYTGVHPMSICKECYNSNNEDRKRKQEEEWEARKAERAAGRTRLIYAPVVETEAEREARERAEQQRQALARELSIQANQRCPRCKQLRTDGHVWPDGRIFFHHFCETCRNGTPHTIYKMICPLIKAVRYIGITVRNLDKRLSQHVTGHGGTEYKQYWIDELRLRGLKPEIAPVSEAPNERAAKLEETRHIYHHIQQGHPLVNAEATSPQLVLFLQSSTTNWLEASEEEIKATYSYNGQVKLWSMNWGMYRKSLWLHRNDMVYLMQNGKAPYELFYDGIAHDPLSGLRAEYEKTYPTIMVHTELPTDLKERESILSKATIVKLRTYTDFIASPLIEHDCTFLLARNIPIQVEDYTKAPSVVGSLKAVDSSQLPSQRKGKRAKSSEHSTLIIHPSSYSVPSERSLAIIPSHTFHEWSAYEYKRSNRYTISEPIPSVREVQTGSLW